MAVSGGDDLVRIVADGDFGDDVEAGWIDNSEGAIVLGEDQQGCFGGGGLG
jgi:hypothetical protein